MGIVDISIEVIKRALEKIEGKKNYAVYELIEIIPIENFKLGEDEKRILNEEKGCFVKIEKEGELRGCIGTFKKKPLWINIEEQSIFSAFSDPRFPPLQKEEFPKISVEISVVSEPKPAKPEEIRLGEDGVIIEKFGKGAVLLPSIVEKLNIKTKEEFFSIVCRKAGIEEDAWKKPDTKIKIFSVFTIR